MGVGYGGKEVSCWVGGNGKAVSDLAVQALGANFFLFESPGVLETVQRPCQACVASIWDSVAEI